MFEHIYQIQPLHEGGQTITPIQKISFNRTSYLIRFYFQLPELWYECKSKIWIKKGVLINNGNWIYTQPIELSPHPDSTIIKFPEIPQIILDEAKAGQFQSIKGWRYRYREIDEPKYRFVLSELDINA